MLKNIHIENIAVIERADIEFASGLNVLSGETGAGKSIIIDSINTVLGNRTSKDIVRTGADYALVTASFRSENVRFWFDSNEIEYEDEIILQRKISAEGKSSCRVCGVPVSASQIRELASLLVDVHGQNDGLRLLDEKSHITFLDNYRNDRTLLDSYTAKYVEYCDIKNEIDKLTMDESEKIHLIDSLHFTIDEIEKSNLVIGEYDSLVSRRDLLRNSEKLKEALDSAIDSLSDGDSNALNCCDNALFFISKAFNYAPDLEESLSSLKDASFTLKNVSETLLDLRESLDFNESDYDDMENRISSLNRLFRKYNADESGLLSYLEECKEKLLSLEYSDDRLEKLNNVLASKYKDCLKAAEDLSAARKITAETLELRIINELKDLNMPSVRFKVFFNPVPLCRNGIDEVLFLMSANAGEELGKISRIASGGELSRIMLALKNVFAEKDIVDTMIFDEIDAGVSGISAQRVAEKLWNVSKNKQVMCISHLPQIAAMADNEYLVSKSEKNNRTYTEVSLLDFEGRKHEIARMYGGDNISEKTLAAAEEQLVKSEEYKKNGF